MFFTNRPFHDNYIPVEGYLAGLHGVSASFLLSFFLSFHWGLRTAAYEPDGEEDRGERGLLWTLSRHPAKLHEGHTGREHQLCCVWVHEVWTGHSKVDGRVMEPEQHVFVTFMSSNSMLSYQSPHQSSYTSTKKEKKKMKGNESQMERFKSSQKLQNLTISCLVPSSEKRNLVRLLMQMKMVKNKKIKNNNQILKYV